VLGGAAADLDAPYLRWWRPGVERSRRRLSRSGPSPNTEGQDDENWERK
jgi:hypothetical protein